MANKLLLLLIMLLPMVGKAQIAVGDWKIHSIYGNNVSKIIETQTKIFYVVDKNLYSYDKEGKENESFNKRNKLSDILITNIAYNYAKKYLVIAYQNGNLDFLYDNGKIVNLSDIKDVILASSKTINAISFDGDKVYLATDFGYVVVNETKREIAQSQIYNIKLTSIAIVGNNLLIGDGKKLYKGDKTKLYPTISSLEYTGTGTDVAALHPIDDSSFYMCTGWVFKGVIGADGKVQLSSVYPNGYKSFAKTPSNFILQTNAGVLSYFNAKGEPEANYKIPDNLKNSLIASYSGKGNIWAIDSKGLKNSKIDETGVETVLSDYFRPNASTVILPYNMVYNNALNKLYAMNIGSNEYIEQYDTPATINTLEGSFWKDITPVQVEERKNGGAIIQNGILRDPYQPVFDPDDPSVFFVGTWWSGAYKLKDNKCLAHYMYNNSPMVEDWACLVPVLQFDKNKNLWIVQTGAKETNPIMILPRAKQSQANLTPGDWKVRSINGVTIGKKMHFMITKKGDFKLFTNGEFSSVLSVLDDNSTIDIASDDRTKVFSSFLDQDEKSYDLNYLNCFVEDRNGKVWLGTGNGVVEFNPANVFNSNFRINRIKVPRNDGTSYADYLLENTVVTCMAVDGANRKWIGTQSAGLFLVSPDGTEILKTFTTSNSYLPDNNIYSVVCNPNNNSVYIGTPYGIVEYSSDATPAESTYDNVYAYPNPVRPGYTGWITIRGLMDNSLVKITDAQGNVVFSGNSTGGMITWDGTNSTGARVKTGVYYVLASQSSGDSSKGAVTKIMIVN